MTASSTGEGRPTASAPLVMVTASEAKVSSSQAAAARRGAETPAKVTRPAAHEQRADRRVAHGEQQVGRRRRPPDGQRDEHLEQHAERGQRDGGVEHGLHADPAAGRAHQADADEPATGPVAASGRSDSPARRGSPRRR